MNQTVQPLTYFRIGDQPGWNQDHFADWAMRLAGCAAVSACDVCIQLAKDHGFEELYPFDVQQITAADYEAFSRMMKPYLSPRFGGITKLELYTQGLRHYLARRSPRNFHFAALYKAADGANFQVARQVVTRQLDARIPVPFLLLKHQDKAFDDLEWHWFNLTGYREESGRLLVKCITYGEELELDLARLWDTGRRRKGGLVQITW